MDYIIEPLLSWYQQNKRDLPWRKDRDPYHIWVSEIMLQQTRVDTVIPYYLRFLSALPTVEALANAPEDQLLKLWQGLGYYSRVRNMKKAAQMIITEYGGNFPRERKELLKLPGIGPYASGSIGSIAFERPYPAVDGNVLRVFARLRNDDTDIASAAAKRNTEALVTSIMPKGRCGDFTQALMELGACVCLPNGEPRCSHCPVQAHCMAYRAGTMCDLPVKTGGKPRRIEEKTVLVMRCGDRYALRRRPDTGLLANLWELPWINGKENTDGLIEKYRDILTMPPEPLGEAKHIFSHIEWHMTGYLLQVYDEEAFPGVQWFSPEMIRDTLSVPTAFSAYTPYIFRGMKG